MRLSEFQANAGNRVFVLDPRTKILIVFTISLFVLGAVQAERVGFFNPVLCIVPIVLLVISGKTRTALVFLTVYVLSYLAMIYIVPITTGIVNYLVLGTTVMVLRLMPGFVAAAYLFSSTTVSEFIAAMEKLHVTEKLTIPISVIFRFLPTVADEFAAINDAMRMRGIKFWGGNPLKILEYRLVPLMICSANIGQELSASALTRGLGGNVKRTNVCEIGFHFFDYIVLTICAVPYGWLILSWLGIV